MKISTTVLLVGGLALAGTVMGAEPPAQENGTASASMKMAIDPRTGKIRALTADERAELDAKARANRAAAQGQPGKARSGAYLPATQAEAEAGRMVRAGIVTIQPTADTMSDLQVVRNADGTLSYSEHGVPVLLEKAPARTVEAARE